MEEVTPEDIFFPLHLMSTILATNPHNIIHGKTTINPWKILYMVIFLTFCTITTIFSKPAFQNLVHEDLAHIKTIRFVVYLEVSGATILFILTIINTCFQTQKLQNELYKIVAVDPELKKYNMEEKIKIIGKNHRKKVVVLLCLINIVFTILANAISVYFTIKEPRWYYVLIFSYPRLVIGNVNIGFYLVTMMLEERYRMINEILQKKQSESRNMKNYPNYSNFCVEITHLVSLHKNLTKIAERVNSIFSLHLLVWIAINFGCLISDSYIFFHVIFFKAIEQYLSLVITLIKNVVIYIFDLGYITKRCFDLCLEADRTRKILVSINIGVEKEDERNAVIVATLKLMQNKLEMTACKLFKIDNALLFSICGAAASYLFIMIQLDLGNQKTNSTNF